MSNVFIPTNPHDKILTDAERQKWESDLDNKKDDFPYIALTKAQLKLLKQARTDAVLIAYITCHIRRIPTRQQPLHYAHFAAPPCISIKYSKKDPTKSLKKVFVGSLLYGFLIWSAIFW